MAFLEFDNVRIAGMSAGVPSQVVDNLSIQQDGRKYSSEIFVKESGVRKRRYSAVLCTSDLCCEAAEKLIADLGWNKDEIGALAFVSQSADYMLPCTACILQDRLGLSTECYAFDCTLGCSGWVYGLSQVLSLLSAGSIRKALLMCGDIAQGEDASAHSLFGSAGTVTAVEYKEGAGKFRFHFGTDGSGYDAIILPVGARNRGFLKKTKESDAGNKLMSARMNGLDVLAFSVTRAPESVRKLAEHYGFDYQDSDYYVFHQANMKINNLLIKRLGLDAGKVPHSIGEYGNTSSASIPLTIVTQLKDRVTSAPARFICCGFGVGLSWGTVAFSTDGIVVPDLVEVSDGKAWKGYNYGL